MVLNKHASLICVVFFMFVLVQTTSASYSENFDTICSENWDIPTGWTVGIVGYSGCYNTYHSPSWGVRIYLDWISKDIDVTGANYLTLWHINDRGDVYINNSVVGSWSSSGGVWTYSNFSLPANLSGVQTVKIACPSGVDVCHIDDLYIDSYPTATLSGFVKNTLGYPISAATISLNNGGGSTTSNDIGYYEISDISSGTYTISVTSPTHQDYTESGISITSNTVKNITMTRITPILSNVRIIDKTDTYIWLGWNENTVVDSVNVFKDTDSHLLTTVNTAGSNVGSYKDQNLACDKGYVYWLQPVDGSVTGTKTRIDGKTDPCNDGGGDGGTPTPTPTPGPTPPPWINITDDEWLNLTLNLPMVIKPWFNISFEDLWDWLLLLLIIICLTVWLDSFTTQKISRDWGFIAIFPAIYFGYIGGYFII